LDASDWDESSEWKWMESFYDAFFQAVGAPEWHGRNLNAMNDSIGTGGINQIEVPYKIVIQNVSNQNPLIASVLESLSGLVTHLQSEGCPVQLKTSFRNH